MFHQLPWLKIPEPKRSSGLRSRLWVSGEPYVFRLFERELPRRRQQHVSYGFRVEGLGSKLIRGGYVGDYRCYGIIEGLGFRI